MTQKLWQLKSCELFRTLESADLQFLEARSCFRDFAPASPIYLPADEEQSVYVLARGRAKVCHLTDDGKQSILSFIEAGELFGELALLEPGTRDEYVEALEASTVVMIPRDDVYQLMNRNTAMTLSITKLIGLRRRRIERRLKNLLFLSNRERLLHLLLDLVEDYGVLTDNGTELRIRLSHQDLASIIGSTRETVTVLLGKLQTNNLLRIRRRRITLLDLPRLAQNVSRRVPRAASLRSAESEAASLALSPGRA